MFGNFVDTQILKFHRLHNYVIGPNIPVCYALTFFIVMAHNKLIFTGTRQQSKEYIERRKIRLGYSDTILLICNNCFSNWIIQELDTFSDN